MSGRRSRPLEAGSVLIWMLLVTGVWAGVWGLVAGVRGLVAGVCWIGWLVRRKR